MVATTTLSTPPGQCFWHIGQKMAITPLPPHLSSCSKTTSLDTNLKPFVRSRNTTIDNSSLATLFSGFKYLRNCGGQGHSWTHSLCIYEVPLYRLHILCFSLGCTILSIRFLMTLSKDQYWYCSIGVMSLIMGVMSASCLQVSGKSLFYIVD